jgi:hypothetical protein
LGRYNDHFMTVTRQRGRERLDYLFGTADGMWFKQGAGEQNFHQELRLRRSICALEWFVLIDSIAELVYVGNRDKAKDVDTTELLALARTVAG